MPQAVAASMFEGEREEVKCWGACKSWSWPMAVRFCQMAVCFGAGRVAVSGNCWQACWTQP